MMRQHGTMGLLCVALFLYLCAVPIQGIAQAKGPEEGKLSELVKRAIDAGPSGGLIMVCPGQGNATDIDIAVDRLFDAVVDGRGIAPNSFREILGCLRSIARDASPNTKRQIGMMSSREDGIAWMREAAEAGDAEATMRYARLLEGPTKAERAEGARWMTVAADLNHPGAQCTVGLGLVAPLTMSTITSLSADTAVRAERWLTACARNDNPFGFSCSPVLADRQRGQAMCRALRAPAMTALGRLYLATNGAFGRHPEKAARWLDEAIGLGDMNGALLLSQLYERGDGVTKNLGRAKELLEQYKKFRASQITH